ncbi:ParB family protein, partial [Shigella sonnei]
MENRKHRPTIGRTLNTNILNNTEEISAPVHVFTLNTGRKAKFTEIKVDHDK